MKHPHTFSYWFFLISLSCILATILHLSFPLCVFLFSILFIVKCWNFGKCSIPFYLCFPFVPSETGNLKAWWYLGIWQFVFLFVVEWIWNIFKIFILFFISVNGILQLYVFVNLKQTFHRMTTYNKLNSPIL